MKRKRFIKNCVIVGAVMLLYLCVPQMHIPDREPHMHGELAPLRRRGAPQFPNKFRGKALPAGEAGRARDQSSYSGIGMPLSDKIVSNN